MVPGDSEATVVNETSGEALNQLVISQPQPLSFNSFHAKHCKDLSN